MQPIERYGLVALVFLGITITAAFVWEPEEANAGSGSPEDARASSNAIARAVESKDRAGTSNRVSGRAMSQKNQEAQKAKPKGLSAAQRAELLALQGGKHETSNTNAAGPGRGNVGDAMRPKFQKPAGGELVALGNAARPLSSDAKPVPTQEKRTDPAPISPKTKKTAAPAKGRVYEVRSNDTLSEIAMRELGTWKRWKEIVELNPGLDPNRLREGARIVLPADAKGTQAKGTTAKAQQAPKPAAARTPSGATHTVQQNESLWKIAAARLGSGERWTEIAKLNPDINPDRLTVGMKLVLPKGAASAGPRDTVAQAEPAAASAAERRTTGKVR